MIATRPASGVMISRRIWTTPQILWRALAALWFADVVVLMLFLVAGHIQQAALSSVGKDSAPSIIASEQIKSSLSGMDADAASELLSSSDSNASTALKSYSARRTEAASALIAAAQKITYGDAERRPILRIQLDLGTYETLLQRARDLRKDGDPSFVAVYKQAAQLLDSEILPAADALDRANLDELDEAYARQESSSVISRTALSCAILFFLMLLVAVQFLLFRRTRRLLNLPLVAASLLLVFFSANTFKAVNTAQSSLKRAKEDAFISIHALWQARAVAYAANADESRYLLDPQRSGEHSVAFFAKIDRLGKLPPGVTYEGLSIPTSRTDSGDGFSGYLADELHNITFAGEGKAARETLRDFARYTELDGEIRALQKQGQHQAAVQLCVGRAPGQSGWAFQLFDTALGRTLKINQDAFDESVARGFRALQFLGTKTAVFAALMAMLSLLGVLPRIREYF